MLRIAIILILAAYEISFAASKVTVVGPSKPLIGVETTYSCEGGTGSSFTWVLPQGFTTTTNPRTAKKIDITSSVVKSGNLECSVGGVTGSLPIESVPATPEIIQTGGVPNKFQVGGAYTLSCDSESYAETVADKVTWSWTKKDDGSGTTYGTIDGANSKEYVISEAKMDDKGNYKCMISMKKSDTENIPAQSQAFEVDIISVLGVQCDDNKKCADRAKDHSAKYTGTCDTKTKRCVCKGKAKPEGCDSGTTTVLASLSMTLTVAMVIIGRLL